MLLVSAQVLFTLLALFCLVYDVVLLISVLRQRFFTGSDRKKYPVPVVYIIFMSSYGACVNLADFFMVDALPVSSWIDPQNGYETYRQTIGKQISLISTFCYLTPLFLNWLMTIQRVFVIMFPLNTKVFSDFRLVCYCTIVSLFVLASLLIPYFSDCSVNFNTPTSSYIAECAPDRHPITLFQNKYIIWLPVSAMAVNVGVIVYVKYSRKEDGMSTTSVSATQKRENVMIRQSTFIAAYLSFYEIGYLFMRLYPDQFQSFPQEVIMITYYCRLFAICSLNFFVFFVQTRSTRLLVLQFLGIRGVFEKKVSSFDANVSKTRIN